METHQFSKNLFRDDLKAVWDRLLPQIKPAKALDIGAYEGATACYLIQSIGAERPLEIHCMDTWEGETDETKSEEIKDSKMSLIELRFHHNTRLSIQNAAHDVDLHVHKGLSDLSLSQLLVDGKRNYFDLMYVNGSHQACDVLCDAVLGFRLLRKGGLLIFNDYLWYEHFASDKNLKNFPKPAIDAFTNLYFDQIKIVTAPLYQVYILKNSE